MPKSCKRGNLFCNKLHLEIHERFASLVQEEATQNVPEPSQGDQTGIQGIPVEVRDMASKIGFEIGSRPFQLFYTAYEKWKSDFKPAFNSPGSAKATMDMFSTLYEMGFRERDLLDQQQVNRFKESVKPKMVHMVPPNFINGLEAAFEAVANPNPRKRKNSWDSQEGDGDDGERDGTKDASGSGTSQGVQRAKRYILEKLYKFFDPVLKDFNSASKIYLEVTEKEIEDFMVTLGGRDRTVAGFHLDSEATDQDIHACVRKSLVERWNNRKKWIGNLQQQANVEDALRFNSFGADEEEFEKYQSSQSHLEYLQKSLGPLNNEDDKFVFIVEGKDSPVLLAGGVVFGSLENIVHDTDKVSVFIMHRANNSKKTSMVLPSGTIKVGKELKKHTVVELPVQSLLGRFNKQQVKEWAFSHGCTNVLWNDSMVQYKGKLALVA
ncbi:hypothetical protein VOLCADRAFT_108596 [Volvox carteri f. nagariensis]|uniref:Uncharacterized protein n=1 Tax=Volvox carteri f. nagariensis TaxID=3068 RepID=D8UL65_VOLCA|nr:uncharacterized protein VOLCADRAFT_108596 [Volvox carteri f. nagariensis]EFJ39536.1 hypothetical protein VOLCADRAFT_108596 [Volvox carteri f. nagariensis]|eukprot:XP_002959401.1 hypothetical protein VOLCADRAFT_108596 [Volvox carteri f. nagariensis]